MTREEILNENTFQAFMNQCAATLNLQTELVLKNQLIEVQEKEISNLRKALEAMNKVVGIDEKTIETGIDDYLTRKGNQL